MEQNKNVYVVVRRSCDYKRDIEKEREREKKKDGPEAKGISERERERILRGRRTET